MFRRRLPSDVSRINEVNPSSFNEKTSTVSRLAYRQLERRNEELESKLTEAKSKLNQAEEALRDMQKSSDNFATVNYMNRIKMACQAKREKRHNKEVIHNLNMRLEEQKEDLDKICMTIRSIQTRFICQNQQNKEVSHKEEILDVIEQISRHFQTKEEELQDTFARLDYAANQVKREKREAKAAMSKKDSSIEVLNRENRQLREEKDQIDKKYKDLGHKYVKLQMEISSEKYNLLSCKEKILKVIEGSSEAEGDHKRKRDEEDNDDEEESSNKKQRK